MKRILMLIMACGMMLMGCGGSQKSVSVNDLAGEWEIVKVNGKLISAEETPFLGFNVAESQLYGNAGCNSLMGILETSTDKSDALSFGALGSTKRMCADMETEDVILQALGNVKAFALENGVLTLKNEKGTELVELKKRP